MLQNEELAARPGLLQRLDPRIKLLTLVLFAVTASLVHSVWVLIALIGVTIALAAASRVGVASFERRVWLSAGLLALLVAAPSALRIFTPGPVVVSLGPLALTEPGLMGVATLVTRVVASAGFALLVVWTMRWSDLLKALTAMRLPDVVVATLAMTQKQILTLLRTVEQIHLARESRTLDARQRARGPRLGDGAHGLRGAQVDEDRRRRLRRDAVARVHRRDAVAGKAAPAAAGLGVVGGERRALCRDALRRQDDRAVTKPGRQS